MVRRSVGWAVVLAGLSALVWIVGTSLDPKSYFSYARQGRTGWEHPTSSVAFIAVAVILETALAYFVFALRRPWHIWARALVGLAVLAPWGWWVSEFVVHAPGYWILHIMWVWLLIALLTVGAMFSGARHTFVWGMSKRSNA
jgi:hypothetical protein